MQKSLFYTRLYNLQSKVQVLISRTRKHLLSKTARTIVCVQDDITSLLIIGFRQNATLLTTTTVIGMNFKMLLSTLTDCAALESCCADLERWKKLVLPVSILVVTLVVVCSILLCYVLVRQRDRERKDTWMERIKQTYIILRPSWRSDCEFDISYRGTNTDSRLLTNDDELVKALHKRDTEKRVLFVGEPGIGKSHLFQSIAMKWANGEILQDVIVIYLRLDSVPKQACIVHEVMKVMKRENSEKEIESLTSQLQCRKSILLLDGISNWSRYCKTTSNNANRDGQVLTVEELLEPRENSFENMRVWVTSRSVDADKNVMKGNFTQVNLKGLNVGQREMFFQKFLEIERKEKKIWSFLSKIWQRQSKINKMVNYITKTCCHNDVPIRSPAIARYLAKMYDSDKKTYFSDFPDMIKTTTSLMELENSDLDLNLLVCLLEVGTADDNVYRTCAILLHMKKLVFNHINDDYFKEAMIHLLNTLRESDMVITSLTIYGDCPITLFSCLPKIQERLVICNVHFTEIDFITIIKTLSQQQLSLEFRDSEVPKKFPVIELLDNCPTKNLSVFRSKGVGNPEKLSWEEGVWTKQKTKEDIHHIVEENRSKEQDNEQTEPSHH